MGANDSPAGCGGALRRLKSATPWGDPRVELPLARGCQTGAGHSLPRRIQMTLRAMYVAPLVAIGAAFAATGFADPPMTSYSEPPVSQSTMAPSDPGTPIPAAEDASPNPDAIPARTEPVAARADTSSTTTIYGERRT